MMGGGALQTSSSKFIFKNDIEGEFLMGNRNNVKLGNTDTDGGDKGSDEVIIQERKMMMRWSVPRTGKMGEANIIPI